jgi:hypothetical protein
MSLTQKVALRLIDRKRVQTLSIIGSRIHLETDAGPRDFEFETEQEAMDAIQGWFVEGFPALEINAQPAAALKRGRKSPPHPKPEK